MRYRLDRFPRKKQALFCAAAGALVLCLWRAAATSRAVVGVTAPVVGQRKVKGVAAPATTPRTTIGGREATAAEVQPLPAGAGQQWVLVSELHRCAGANTNANTDRRDMAAVRSLLQITPAPRLVLLTSCPTDRVPQLNRFYPEHVAVINGLRPLFYSQTILGGLYLAVAQAFGESARSTLAGLAWVDLDMVLSAEDAARLSRTLVSLFDPKLPPLLLVVDHATKVGGATPGQASTTGMKIDVDREPGALPSGKVKFSSEAGHSKMMVWHKPTAKIWRGWASAPNILDRQRGSDGGQSRVRCNPPLKNCCECGTKCTRHSVPPC